jgi:hypothetical protein
MWKTPELMFGPRWLSSLKHTVANEVSAKTHLELLEKQFHFTGNKQEIC